MYELLLWGEVVIGVPAPTFRLLLFVCLLLSCCIIMLHDQLYYREISTLVISCTFIEGLFFVRYKTLFCWVVASRGTDPSQHRPNFRSRLTWSHVARPRLVSLFQLFMVLDILFPWITIELICIHSVNSYFIFITKAVLSTI